MSPLPVTQLCNLRGFCSLKLLSSSPALCDSVSWPCWAGTPHFCISARPKIWLLLLLQDFPGVSWQGVTPARLPCPLMEPSEEWAPPSAHQSPKTAPPAPAHRWHKRSRRVNSRKPPNFPAFPSGPVTSSNLSTETSHWRKNPSARSHGMSIASSASQRQLGMENATWDRELFMLLSRLQSRQQLCLTAFKRTHKNKE